MSQGGQWYQGVRWCGGGRGRTSGSTWNHGRTNGSTIFWGRGVF